MTAIFGTHDGFTMKFQYRKRYEVTCDEEADETEAIPSGFNTASGMRSHVTGAQARRGRGVRRVSIPQAV